MSRPLHIACCSPIPNPGWRWISRALGEQHTWEFFNTAPRSRIEQRITKPSIARFRACREVARAANRPGTNLLVTHSPLITCWSELFRSGGRPGKKRVPHLAFSFNFTELPAGIRHRLMRRAFANVDRFVVFSEFEQTLYSERFGIPLEKIDMIHWGVQAPPDDDRSPLIPGEYICAVGSQGRDYRLLLNALRLTPEIQLAVVATPENLTGLSIPENVTIHTNIPREDCNNIIRHSRFMTLPLLHSEVPCGHVTLVTAMYLAKAIIATESAGITDYIHANRNGIFAPPGDPEALAARLRELWNDRETTQRMGTAGREIALAHCTEQTTIDYMRRLLDRLATTGTI